ncbi:MAG TPA: hypothetical protein VIJ36_15005, partial [Thermoanaerobaculia bacterium]
MRFVLLPLMALAVATPPVQPPPASPSFERCKQLAATQPESEATARCFSETGTALQQKERGTAGLQELLRRYPGSPWPTFFLVVGTPDPDRLSRLADLFAARGDAKGEVLCRINLYRLLFNTGRIAEAGTEADRALRAAQASGDPELLGRARVLKARHLWGTGTDLEGAYLLLRQAEPILIPGGSYSSQREYLLSLANLNLDLGLYADGLATYRRMAELAAANHDLYTEPIARYGMARAVMDQAAELPTAEGRQEVIRLAQETLGPATAARNQDLLSKVHLALGMFSQGKEAEGHFAACLATAGTARNQSYCLNALARFLSKTDVAAAQKTIDRSLELARQAQDPWSMAFAWRERMRVSWSAGAGERAVEDSRAALDVIEALRDQQAGSSGQAKAFSTWSEDYYWLSGQLITAAQGEGRPEDLDQAFQVSERLRARTLIDTLEAAHAVPAAAAPIRQKRGAALERISTVQRRLLDPALPAAERATATQELERQEVEEADLRNQLARAAPALGASR